MGMVKFVNPVLGHSLIDIIFLVMLVSLTFAPYNEFA